MLRKFMAVFMALMLMICLPVRALAEEDDPGEEIAEMDEAEEEEQAEEEEEGSGGDLDRLNDD